MKINLKKTLAQSSPTRRNLNHEFMKMPLALNRISYFTYLIFALGLAILLSFNLNSVGSARVEGDHIRMVRELETDELGIQNPAGIAFSQQANVFHVMEANRPSHPPLDYSDIVMITTVEQRIGSAHLAATIADPKNTAFDNKFNRLLILQTDANKLISVAATPHGNLDASSLKRYAARDFDLQDPQGIAVDPASGQVFILDSAVPQIVQIQPLTDGSFEGAAISQVALQINSSAGLQGLAFEPTNGHYQVLDTAEQVLYEFNSEGELVTFRDLSSFNLVNPQTLVYAPSGDPTDDPAIMNLYLVDTALTIEPARNLQSLESELEVQAVEESAGRIIEFSLVPYPQLTSTVPTDSVTLVITTETSQFQTPDDPTDDSINYTPTIGYTGSDTIVYQVCDATPDCETATVYITINPLTSLKTVDSSQVFTPNITTTPAPVDDYVTMFENTWMNIDVLDNDDFGSDGPGTGPITIVTPPSNGTAAVNDGPRSPDPSGLVYLRDHPTADYTSKLLISDGEVNEIEGPNPAAYTGYNLFITTLAGSLESTLTTYNPPDVTISHEPTGVAYNPANDHLFFTDDDARMIYELNPGDDGLYNTSDDAITSINTNTFGSTDPEGITFDGSRDQGHVIVVDGLGEEVYDIDLGSNGTLNASDSVSHFDVTIMLIRDPEGILFNQDNGHLYILSSKGEDALIAETTIDGTLIRYLDISATNPDSPAGLTYAPASDGSGGSNLYIVDRGKDNNPVPMENDGKMYEVSFPFEINIPPSVDAGPNQTIIFEESANLDGTVDDDGNPDPPATVTTLWSQVSEPQTGVVVNFADPKAVDTIASNFTVPGEYVLRLTASDGEQTNYDEVTITVDLNQPPNVSAGTNQFISLPEVATLDGMVSDDGLPDPPGSFATVWSKVSGPGPVNYADASAEDTTASFSNEGVYVLRLTADDTELTNFDQVTITVNSAPNQLPSVDAGPNQSITLPDSAALDGTVTDDGLPDPPGSFTTLWSVVSGPGLVTFKNASAVNTTASFSMDGVYQLLLSADDSERSAIDTILISVNPAPVRYVWLPVILSKP